MQRITTVEAAERLGLSRFRIFQFIKGKRLPAVKVGRDWLINPDDLKLVEDRKPGRPTKKAPAKKSKKS
jgi:excisionase family DNA binding protein